MVISTTQDHYIQTSFLVHAINKDTWSVALAKETRGGGGGEKV